jgi:hypothetical protein
MFAVSAPPNVNVIPVPLIDRYDNVPIDLPLAVIVLDTVKVIYPVIVKVIVEDSVMLPCEMILLDVSVELSVPV